MRIAEAPDAQDSTAPSRPRYFPGWNIVGVAFLANVAKVTTFSSTFSVFMRPLSAEFGVGLTALSLIRTGEMLVEALLLPLIGGLLDRRGARGILAVGAFVSALGLILLSLTQDFWQFTLVRVLIAYAGAVLLSGPVVSVAISNWFVRRRGRAIAIANLGVGLAKVFMPMLAALLLVGIGWRGVWVVFGGIVLVLAVGPALVFVRRRPEDVGLRPDGDPPGAPQARPAEPLNEMQRAALNADVVWTRREALRTQALWIILITYSVASTGVVGLNLHLFSYLTETRFVPESAALVLGTIAAGQMASSVGWGLLVERLDPRRAWMLQFLVQASGLSIAIATQIPLLVFLGFAVYGLGLGGSFVIQETIWASFYGRLSLGAVRSIGVPFSSVFSALGPVFFGGLFDLTRSYLLAFQLFIAGVLVSAALTLFIRPPHKSMPQEERERRSGD